MEVYDLSKENELERIQFQREMRLKALHKNNLVKVKKIIASLMCHPWRHQKEVFDAMTKESKKNMILL